MVNFGTPLASSTFSRVSTVLGRNVILGNLRKNQESLLRVQEELATGFSLLRPSDDPVRANRVLDFNLRISRDLQFIRNINTATARLEMSDLAVDGANEILTRAREILLEQVGSTATAQTRLAAANEVSALLQQAVNFGNTQFEDRFLFAGSRSQQAPFIFVGGQVAFTGNVLDFNADLADGLRLPTNVSADNAFGVLSPEILGLDLVAGPTFLQPVDLDPAVTAATRLTALNGGGGVRLGSIQVTGTGTATIDLAIAETVDDVIGLINAQTGVTGVTALIDPLAFDSLQLTAGVAITVAEVSGGSTAADLGILGTGGPPTFDGTPLDPALTVDTLIGDLFGGTGLDPSGLTITNGAFSANFFGAATFGPGVTIEKFLSDLNNANLFVDARINDGATGIDVVSRLSGGRLSITEFGGGTTAFDLGLLYTDTGATTTLARARLQDLNGGLGVGPVDGFDMRITRKDGVQVFFDVDSAPNVQALVDAIDGDPFLTATIVGTAIEVTDTTGGVGPLTIENFNGSFAATNLGVEATTAGVTITGTALTFAGVQVEGIYTALIRLRDALQANDTVAVNSADRLINLAQDQVLEARADTGSRVRSLELTRNRLTDEKLELEKLRSSNRDADLAEAATRFQIQQTVLEASLSVAARILETSIFNFL